MTALRKRVLAIWATAFMVLSTWTVMTVAAETDEGAAEARLATPAPMWKVNDFWRYSYTGRSTSWTWSVTFTTTGGGTIPGIASFTGTVDHYEYYGVNSVSDNTWFQVSFTGETWQNGTYTFQPQGYPASSPGNFHFWSKGTTVNPMKYRKTDLAAGDYISQNQETQDFTDTSYGGYLDSTTSDQVTNTYSSGAFVWYKFPMDFNQNWPLTGVISERHVGTSTTEADPPNFPNGHTTTWDYTDTYTYTSASGITSPPPPEYQTTPAGSYDDCYKIRLTGNMEFSETGSMTRDGRPQNINFNDPDNYFDTSRWYSNTAGNIVNYNSTAPNNGVVLTSYHYIAIPPNFKPAVQTVAGGTYSPSVPMTIPVKEDIPESIEIAVLDSDLGDTLNWTVVSITGASTNPIGASLMDGAPAFTTPNPTLPDLTGLHSNRLQIVAKQPKTNDRDEYTIKIEVSDGKEAGSANFTFKVRVLNVNDKPQVMMNIPDVWMRENNTMTCTTWKLSDIFKDPDREAGIIEDRLTYTAVVTSGPWLSVAPDNDTATVTFTVPDYAFAATQPTGWESSVKFTATDSGCGNPANKTTNITNAKVRIEHVNHEPIYSDNGTKLADEGLVWAEDVIDTRLDLTRAFKDYDTSYAGDTLTFTFSGQKYLNVKNNQGKITLTPERDWNGRETIKFKATDSYGKSKELRVECEVMAVNDYPSFCETEMDILWEDTEALTIKEANTPSSPLNKLSLMISVKDPDVGDTHSVTWYVNDSQGNQIYKSPRPVANDDDHEFKCDWTDVAPHKYSAAGSPYEVKAVVIDQKGAVALYVWNVTVVNTNRLPTVRVDSPLDNKSFKKGSKVFFDAGQTQDLDEMKENLTFIWSSNKQGVFKQERGWPGAQFNETRLKTGTHIITLTIQDSDGGQASYTFTVKIKEEKAAPGFETVVLAASVAVVVVLLGRRRK